MSPASATPLHLITVLFVIALAGETATRLWLASRQIGAVSAHRDRVPDLFSERIGLPDQQRAADYTVARVRVGRWATVFEAIFKLGLTLGGGLAALEVVARRSGWPEPWQGTLEVLAALLLLSLLGLPFTLWRTFRVEARFGF